MKLFHYNPAWLLCNSNYHGINGYDEKGKLRYIKTGGSLLETDPAFYLWGYILFLNDFLNN